MSTTAAPVLVDSFFEAVSATFTHVVHSGEGSECVIIDPVLDYDPKSGRTDTKSMQRVLAHVQARRLKVSWILETHAHADHLSAAAALKEACGAPIGIGERITEVQGVFKRLFNLGDEFVADGRQFDRLLKDGDPIEAGALHGEVMAVPGHTPACLAFRFGDAVFVGDTLFMPDVGTARCDFPGGDAATLYRSLRRILALPGDTRLFMCHDYPPGARPVASQTTVAAQRAANVHVRDGISEEQFVEMRTTRDATLAMPVLILPAIQLNIRAGRKPPPEANGVSYLKIPLDGL